jgi:DNA-binding beta-propeller fold protein YncE
MRGKTMFSSLNRLCITGLILSVVLVSLIALTVFVVNGQQGQQNNTPGSPNQAVIVTGGTNSLTPGRGGIQHYEYVFPDGWMYVYDMDNGHKLVKSVRLPTNIGVRGVVASQVTHMLYVSYGGDGGHNGNGFLLKYDLVADRLVWTTTYSHGIDSMAISPDGKTIYMPDGELTSDGIWYVFDANSGNQTGTIYGGLGPHNTIVSLNGAHVYLGGRNHNYLEVADRATNQVIKNIGPLYSGVRPFTINGSETIAYTTATGFLGFQVSDIGTGQVLFTVPIKGFSWNGRGPSAPSHGISLSPDEKELYVMDSPNSYVHVFNVSGVPATAPVQVADIKVTSMAGSESDCAYDCLKDGWLQHSRDGRFVYVGDSGDVIDTVTRRSVINLPTLANTRKMLEIDWQNGIPIFTTSRSGLGYVTNPANIAPALTVNFVILNMYDVPSVFNRRVRNN